MGVLVVLLVAIVAYAMFFVNSATFKTQLQKVALEKADIHLRIDGDIQWSFFPWLGLELDDIGVSMGKDPEIVQFDRAEFGLSLLPLLKQSIKVDQVRLVNLKANLTRDASGHGNWEHSFTSSTTVDSSTTNASATTSENASADQATSADSDKLVIPDFQLDLLQIDNAQVTLRDEQSKQNIDATFNVNLKDVEWNKAWPMVMDAVVKQSDLDGNNALTVSTKLTGNLTVFPERQVFSLADLSLSTKLQGAALPVSPLAADLTVKQVDMDIPQENLFMDQLSIKALGINATAKVKLYQVLSDPQFDAAITLEEFNPREVLKQLNIELPEMADSTAFRKVSGNVSIEGNSNDILIQPLSLALDDTTLKANIVTKLSPLRWDANISGENLDLDRYLPPETEATSSTAVASSDTAAAASSNNTEAKAEAAAAELVPLELVRSLNGHVGFVFKNLIVKKLQLDQVDLDATMTNGVVRISPAAVSLYKGSSTLKALYDARTDTPKLTVSTQVKGIQIKPLLKDFMDLEKISGTTLLVGEINTKGNQVDTLIANLNGDLLAEIDDGALVGMNLTKSVCQGIAAIRKESITSSKFGDDTPFESMNFPIHIVNGEVSTPGLKMASSGLSVTGDGDISLPKQFLEYRVKVAITGSELDNSCRINDNLKNFPLPVICKGNFSDDPAGLCRPDSQAFGQLFKDLATAELKKKAAAEKALLKEKLDAEKARLKEKQDAKLKEEKEKLKDKLKDKLKSLF